jgi:hypothetical protein
MESGQTERRILFGPLIAVVGFYFRFALCFPNCRTDPLHRRGLPLFHFHAARETAGRACGRFGRYGNA